MIKVPQVPGFLGRVLGPDGAAVGTCFQVARCVVVTAWHVLEEVDCGQVGAWLSTDALNGAAPPAPTEVIAADAGRDLAVLRREEPLPETVPGLVATDDIELLTRVVITGVPTVDDGAHDYRHLNATGTWQGGTVRDGRVALGRLTSSAVVPGMSGAPVLRLTDNVVIGVVSARYNSADSWLRDSVWVARIEDLTELLAGHPDIGLSRRVVLDDRVSTLLSVRAPGLPVVAQQPGATPPPVLGGPHETALEAAKVLVAIDDSGRGIGMIGDVVESLLAKAARSGRHGERDVQRFRARIRARGLDPRVLLRSAAQHAEALRRWSEPLGDASGERPDDLSTRMLASLTAVLVDELAGATFDSISPACRRYLTEALLDRQTVTLPAFLNALSMLLPPLRSTSTEAVPVDAADVSAPVAVASAGPAGSASTGAATSYRQAELASAAAQMCRLPDVDPCVTGRSGLVSTIVEAVSSRMARHRSATAFLSGQPGVGTSTVAIEAARRLIPVFPGGVFYVELHGLVPGARRDARTVIRMVSEGLGLDLGTAAMDDARRLAAFAAQLRDRQVLLVLDDALDAGHVAPLMKAPATCAIIVTSRDRVQSYADPGLVFRVEPLIREASVQVLMRCDEQRAAEVPTLHRLAHLCADVPLALRMVGSRMSSRPDLALEYLAQMLEAEATRLDYLDAGDRAVRAAIKLSYDNLDPVGCQTLRLVAAAPAAAVTGAELGHCLGTAPLRQELVLNRLVDRSLAQQEIVRSFSGHLIATFTLFELVLLFAKERLVAEERDEVVRAFQRQSVSYLRDRLNEIADQTREADLSGELDPARFHAAQRLAEEREWFDLATDLASSLHVLYSSRGELDAVNAVNETRIYLHLRRGQPDEAVKACLLNADLLRGKAQRQAVDAVNRAREIALEHNLPARAAEADFKLSVLLWDQDDFTKALAAGEQSVTVLTTIGQEAVAVPVAINNCKMARQAGQTDQALRWGRTATALADRWAEASQRAGAHFERARAESLAGRHLEAIESNRRAEAFYIADKNWWNAAVACQNGANSAQTLHDTATELQLRSLGADHWEQRGSIPHLLQSLVDLSAAYVRAEQYEAAGRSLARAEDAAQQHPDASVAPLLRTEILLRQAALRLFIESMPSGPSFYRPDLVPASGGRAGEPAGPEADEAGDPELGRVRGVLDRYRRGAMSAHEAREQTRSHLAARTRNPPPAATEWLHETLGEQTAPRPALNSGS